MSNGTQARTEAVEFRHAFRALTGPVPCPDEYGPFPWQEELYRRLLEGDLPTACDIPTGLGKTSVIAIWLLALAYHVRSGPACDFPRRLVYVVNRRTVVDQATREAEHMREALCTRPELEAVAGVLRSLAVRPSEGPLAISTLRGQFADNAEWRDDPARPAVIVGTVDMIGSRLLFSGYGRGFKSRPLHAGFLSQDVLLVHDEAHLEPAFQDLITAVQSEQQRCCEFGRFRVMALTATSRGDVGEPCGLTEDDLQHREVRKRIEAKKGIAFRSVEEEKQIADEVCNEALKHKEGGQAVLVFLRKLEDVDKVADKLRKTKLPVQLLSGTLRGLERDALAKTDGVFARFVADPEVEPQAGAVYLVCTSAGEVGINISADHLVCDLTPFDSMTQRFGRVNRFGNGDAQIDVVYCNRKQGTDSGDPNDVTAKPEATKKAKPPSAYDQACERTLRLLQQLKKRHDQRHHASPAALRSLPPTDCQAAFTPAPVILPVSDVLFDAWALTSVRQRLPGRPPVADWLHGVAEWEPPETHVAWRQEVEWVTGDLLERYKPEELLEDYPLKPHEMLRDRTDRIFEQLEAIARRCPELSAWVIEGDGEVNVFALSQLVRKDRQKKAVVDLADCTVLLPPAAGGLGQGMLDGNATLDEGRRENYDVSGQWTDENETPRRCRVWDNDEPPEGMRSVRTIDTRPDADEEVGEEAQATNRRYWHWYARPRSADDDGSRTGSHKQFLDRHLQSAGCFASTLVAKLGLNDPEAAAVRLAARWHDLGKRRDIWQRSIGNHNYPREVLAKSGGKMRPIDLSEFRHEFGSLIDVSKVAEFQQLAPEVQDLVLHLIAAHHGRARPHFPAAEVFDPEHPDETAALIARDVPRRFARLQRKYGRWGLAYIESLLRAADVLASQTGDAPEVAQ